MRRFRYNRKSVREGFDWHAKTKTTRAPNNSEGKQPGRSRSRKDARWSKHRAALRSSDETAKCRWQKTKATQHSAKGEREAATGTKHGLGEIWSSKIVLCNGTAALTIGRLTGVSCQETRTARPLMAHRPRLLSLYSPMKAVYQRGLKSVSCSRVKGNTCRCEISGGWTK